MKIILAFLFGLLISQVVFAQTKIEGHERDYGDSAKVKKLIDALKKDSESPGFIIIPIGKSRERLENILAFISSIKSEINFRLGKDSDKRVSFSIIEGKKLSETEFWVIPKGKKKPKVKEAKIDLNKLKTKYFYATMCSDCFSYSPIIDSERTDFKPFAEALKKNLNYKGLIVVHSSFITWGNRRKDELVREFDLNYEQIDVELGKTLDIHHPIYDFYLIPQKTKIKSRKSPTK